MDGSKEIKAVAKGLGIGSIKRHIVLCAGEKCCKLEDGLKTWSWLKEWCRGDEAKSAGVFRTKATCLRLCREGPIAVVYPEGTWYHSVTPEVCEKIANEHLLRGRIVEEKAFAENPLPQIMTCFAVV